MQMFSQQWRVMIALWVSLLLTACGPTQQQDGQHINVGVIVGAEQQIAQVAQQVAKKRYGLTVELVSFNDYVLPNAALSKGDIDVNAIQHRLYLAQQMKDRNYHFAIVGNSFIYPIAGYSKKITSLRQLKTGDEIAMPNDVTDLGRSLLLLQRVGLITLKENVGLFPSQVDIVANPKQLKLIALQAPQLPRVLDDPQVAIAIINTTYASQIGLNPTKDGLFVEDKESPYVNVIVARRDNQHQEKVKQFVQAYQSPEVLAAAEKIFHGSAIKAW